MELLENLCIKTGCEYISDLRFGDMNQKAKEALAALDFTAFTIRELSDAATYLFSRKIEFDSAEEARKFFRTHIV